MFDYDQFDYDYYGGGEGNFDEFGDFNYIRPEELEELEKMQREADLNDPVLQTRAEIDFASELSNYTVIDYFIDNPYIRSPESVGIMDWIDALVFDSPNSNNKSEDLRIFFTGGPFDGDEQKPTQGALEKMGENGYVAHVFQIGKRVYLYRTVKQSEEVWVSRFVKEGKRREDVFG